MRIISVESTKTLKIKSLTKSSKSISNFEFGNGIIQINREFMREKFYKKWINSTIYIDREIKAANL